MLCNYILYMQYIDYDITNSVRIIFVSKVSKYLNVFIAALLYVPPVFALASFPGLHAQLPPLFVLQATKAGCGGLGMRLSHTYWVFLLQAAPMIALMGCPRDT